jgi:hypothetical protein
MKRGNADFIIHTATYGIDIDLNEDLSDGRKLNFNEYPLRSHSGSAHPALC